MNATSADADKLLEEAQSEPSYVIDELLTEVRRTVALYVHHSTPHGPGFFEPVRLLFCWYDYLGKLYNGKELDGVSSFHAWLTSPYMQARNKNYKLEKKDLYISFRNPLIHSRHGSSGCFAFGPSEVDTDGNRSRNLDRDEDGRLWLDISALLGDLEIALADYLKALESDDLSSARPGSRAAFDRGLDAMRAEAHKNNTVAS